MLKQSNHFKMLLKNKGLKVTPARIAILEIFSRNKLPLDADTVYKKITKTKSTNEATVYRILSSLEKEGILKRVDLRKDSLHFELADKHHHHIVCTSCNQIEDFENKELEKVLLKIRSRQFKNIKEHSLELFGLCRVCA